MSTPRLPSTYELCRIAAALPASPEIWNPEEAIRRAFELWSAAVHELSKKPQEQSQEKTERELNGRKRKKDEVELQRGFAIQPLTPDEVSAAMSWLKENAEDRLDVFAKPTLFENAWSEFVRRADLSASASPSPELLRRFLEDRKARRRISNSERQQRSRRRKKARKMRKRKRAPNTEAYLRPDDPPQH